MKKSIYKVPEKNGEFFCNYKLHEIPDLIKSNLDLINSYNFKIAETCYPEFRKKAGKEILNILQGDGPPLPPRPYIVTGHQPGLCHPGIWIKNMLVDKLSKENQGTAFDIIIDSDCHGEIGCALLTKKETTERKKESLMALDVHQPFECCPVPGNEQFDRFYNKIQVGLQAFPDSPVIKYAEKFYQNGKNAIPASKNLADFLVKTRKGYEANSGLDYFDIMLSSICKTNSFLLFTLHIAEDIQRFSEVYNKELEDYRVIHKLRYKANPFPDLKRGNDKFEIPFWSVKDNKRFPVQVVQEAADISFYVENNCLFRYKKGDFEVAVKLIEENQVNFRPKAVLSTLFLRLFFADIFIHGISGAKYDAITDGVIKRYFNVEPPRFLAASLTLFPDFPVNSVIKDDLEKLKTTIRNIKFKPEIFKDKINDPTMKENFSKLSEEKHKLFQYKPLKNEKKEHFQKLKTITEELSRFLENYLLETKRQLNDLEKKELENEAVFYREFPYFFFDVKKVKGMIR